VLSGHHISLLFPCLEKKFLDVEVEVDVDVEVAFDADVWC
jgi:hypothetical protein